MSGLSSALIVIFVLTITSLAALYLFVTRHQRRFRRQSHLTTATDHESTTTTDSAYYVPSKELLYYFWWNNQSGREGPTAQTTAPDTRPDPSAPADIDIDVLKLIAALQGHTRSPLFTITEDEKTTTETTDRSPSKVQKSDNHRTSLSSSDGDIIGRVSLAGSFGAVEGDVADPDTSSDDDDEVEVEEEEEVMTPSYTTPNASPPYLTPTDSPLHEYGNNTDSTFHVHSFTANSRGRLGFRRSRRPRAELKANKDDDSKVAPLSEESEDHKNREEGGASE